MDLAALDRLFAASPAAVAVIDSASGALLFANPAFRAAEADVLPELARRLSAAEEPRRFAALEIPAADGVGRLAWDAGMVPLDGGAVLVTLHESTGHAAAVAERDRLLRELNHRIKNSLQLISSLMALQAMDCADPAHRRGIEAAAARIGSIAQVHRCLTPANRFSAVPVGEILRDQGEEMARALGAGAAGLTVRVEADDADLPPDQAIPLVLVVNELVTNAARHAYAPTEHGLVTVRLEAPGGTPRRVSVVDAGRGLPPGFDPLSAGTLGMRIVRAFATQLKARLSAWPGMPGAVFVLDLQDP